jgi:predicted Rossmann-fold nucleotide-binding protein
VTQTIDSSVSPRGILEVLSRREVKRLLSSGSDGRYDLFRRCCLAVLNCGAETDDARTVFETYNDFRVDLVRRERGVKLDLFNAPAHAFVDGEMIRGIRELLFAVLRDLIYADDNLINAAHQERISPEDTTDLVFHILRNAGVLRPQIDPDVIVCWGGHAIRRHEYDYTKLVGYEMGLRQLNICTGCGPGAMKGPMKGATIAHAKQRMGPGRYIGVTEPGIVAAEPPNPIVNELVILPDIEKRLEAFVRLGHGIVVFPGGVGTAEEILYILGILLAQENEGLPLPLVFTGPKASASYFEQIDQFIGTALGPKAQSLYQIVVDDPVEVARLMRQGVDDVRSFRREKNDAYYFNWGLYIAGEFQEPFEPDHKAMAALRLQRDMPASELAANLRKAFSGIVAGNVKESGIAAVEQHGPFEINGDPAIMTSLDKLLGSFVADGRMKLGDRAYEPVYRIAT